MLKKRFKKKRFFLNGMDLQPDERTEKKPFFYLKKKVQKKTVLLDLAWICRPTNEPKKNRFFN